MSATCSDDDFDDDQSHTIPTLALASPKGGAQLAAGLDINAEAASWTDTADVQIELTAFEKHGGPLTKEIRLGPGGTMTSDGSACRMARGQAWRWPVGFPHGFAAAIRDYGEAQALALGALKDGLADRAEVTIKAKLNGHATPDVIARTADTIAYRPGHATIALLDVDTKGMPAEISERIESLGGYWRALLAVLPALADVTRVIRASTSSWITNTSTGQRITQESGLHIFVLIQNGEDAKRFLGRLHDRCWLAGFGWKTVNADGTLSERSLVDRMVYGAERIVFEGAPRVLAPLQQDKAKREPQAFDGTAADTAVSVPNLSVAELRKLERLRDKENARLKDQAAKVGAAFIARKAGELAERDGLSLDEARQIIERQCRKILTPRVALAWDDEALAGCTVGHVLADPERFVGATLADPNEGAAYGRGKAMVMRNEAGDPIIHSFAHGERIYELEQDVAEADAASLADDSGYITEDSVALAFAEGRGDELRFDHHAGAWFHWTGSIWRKEETKLAFSWARQTARDLAKEADNAKATCIAGRAAFAAGVERFAQADRAFAVTSEIWNSDPWLLGTPGGTVDLRTGKLRPAQQADFITKQTAVTPAETEACPLWLAFLKQATKDDEALVGFLKRWYGYCLTGITKEHALLFVFGDGGNGKGVCLGTVAGIMGDYAVTAAMDSFTATTGDRHSTDMAMLAGARIVLTTETEEGQHWAEARLKTLTGGDPITARFMRKDFFTFIPMFKLTVSGNHKPALRNVDAAARRRFNLAPFLHRPEKPDKDLSEKLRAEWPGILRWMIEGCLEWQRDGLKQPDVVKLATEAYFSEQDIVHQWVDDCCNLGKTEFDTQAALFKSWTDYAVANGEKPGTSKWFLITYHPQPNLGTVSTTKNQTF